jgi:mono/diheme cytochrome c family protein
MTPAISGRALRAALGAAALVALLALPAFAASEADLRLKPGPDEALVQSVCSACHSVDYVMTNSVFLDRKGWEATVNKMVNVFGAPAQKDEVAKIVEYLARNYGK